MVSPQKIKYNNIFSDEGLGTLDVILDVAFDSDNGAISSYLNRSAVASESHDGRYKNTTGYKYDELFSPQFTIVKKDFSDFTAEEVRKVLKYLTSTDKPAMLEVYYDGATNIVDWACIGGWTSIEMYKLANNRTVGIVATFEAVTPYAMSRLYGRDDDDKPIVYNIVSNNKITIDIDTDDSKPVYPRVTIQNLGSVVRIPDGKTYSSAVDMNLDGKVENTAYFNGATYYWMSAEVSSSTTQPDYNWDVITVEGDYTGKETIKNNKIYYYTKTKTYYWIDPYYFHESPADNPPNLSTTSVKFTNTHTDFFGRSTVLDSTIVKNNNATEFITVDGANRIISSNSVNRIFDDDFNLVWLPLLDGKNEIAVEGNCAVTIEYRCPRKIGEY